jgi:hypothetical protein
LADIEKLATPQFDTIFAKVLRQTNALIRDAVYNNGLLITLTEKQHLFVWITAT